MSWPVLPARRGSGAGDRAQSATRLGVLSQNGGRATGTSPERHGCTLRTRRRGQLWRQRVLPWALSRDSGSQGPLDLLTRLAYRREDSSARSAAGIRGRASPLRSNVARCARSLRSRLRVSSRGRTVAPEPRPFASRGSPQSLGARRARIATADREEPLCPRSRRSACRYGATAVVVKEPKRDIRVRVRGL